MNSDFAISLFLFCGHYNREMGDEVKTDLLVPELVLKKQKRTKEWALAQAKELEEAKK